MFYSSSDSSPQGPEKKKKALEFLKVSIQCLIDSSNTTVLEFYTFHHYYYYTFYSMISVNVGQFDRKVKYYLVLYVDNIRRIHTTFKVMTWLGALDFWHEVQIDHIFIILIFIYFLIYLFFRRSVF